MSAYYNENNPAAAAHLQDLMRAGLIASGDIDTRSIEDVTPNDVRGYTQCHFFAGIGGWSRGLRLAGWPDSRSAWTGSCPCQPFSAAGKGAGFADERHLWPAWQHLIAQCRPPTIFGEQVASKDADAWIDLVHSDFEGMDYAFGCKAFPAAGVGAPHIRDRNYWVAHAGSERLQEQHGRWIESTRLAKANGAADRLADANGGYARAKRQQRGWEQRQQPKDLGVVRLGDINSDTARRNAGSVCGAKEEKMRGQCGHYACASGPGVLRMANADGDGRFARSVAATAARHGHPPRSARGNDRQESAGPLNGFWRDADWLLCTDGKWRPVEPGTQPLAYGLPAGMGKLSPELRRLAEMAGLDAASLKRAKAHRIASLKRYGNAIVPEQAAEFVMAFLTRECELAVVA